MELGKVRACKNCLQRQLFLSTVWVHQINNKEVKQPIEVEILRHSVQELLMFSFVILYQV